MGKTDLSRHRWGEHDLWVRTQRRSAPGPEADIVRFNRPDRCMREVRPRCPHLDLIPGSRRQLFPDELHRTELYSQTQVAPVKVGLMFILTEKLDLPRRAQIFNDHVAEDAAQNTRENDDRLLNRILDAITAIVRAVRQ